MRGLHIIRSGLALAVAFLCLPSCSSFVDCTTRRDCPSDLAYAGGAANVSAKGGSSGDTSATSGKGGTSGVSGTSGESGTEAGAGSGGAAPMCDGSLSPDVDDCVISDEYGVFVSPTGDDATADGTQGKPYATLTKALANGAKKRVYVCAADYVEPATIEIADRVSIYGGFSCDEGNWKYDSSFPAHLLPQSAVGATITDASVGVTLEDVRIDAQNAADDGSGASSFGLAIIRSKNVALKRVEIRAGKGGLGAKGADGATGVDGVASGPDQNGAAGSCTPTGTSKRGPDPVPLQCGSQGGGGGDAQVGTSYASSQDGRGGFQVVPSNGGKGGDMPKKPGANGQPGDIGPQGDTGVAAPPVGAFSANGYAVASGGNGTPGKPGQGGGGGGASLGTATCMGATGGAGGLGGCGGDSGIGGTGGGASVALLSWQSKVLIDSCTLTAVSGGAGGDGGKGHAGGAGKAGGTGGTGDGVTFGSGGDGGRGGFGGAGGNGAGGSGGPSISLVYDGTAPTQLGTSS